jgi:endonuclease IV
MDIPGLGSLVAIHHRDVGRTNNILAQRKEFAAELTENCRKWAAVLTGVFTEAVTRWEREGKAAARREIEKQQEDFQKLNYWSLHNDSPLLKHLGDDERFHDFVQACRSFYQSALNLKRLAYEQIETHPGIYASMDTAGVRDMVQAWLAQLEEMQRAVEIELMAVRVITPK